MRQNREFVAPETVKRMRDRTNWGNITDANYDTKSDMLFFERTKTDVAPYPTTQPTTAPSEK
jgi:hypothetical protein